jgi:hypothetical protein
LILLHRAFEFTWKKVRVPRVVDIFL